MVENKIKKIVVLDGQTVHLDDLNWNVLKDFGELTVYDSSPEETVSERINDAFAVFTSKVPLSEPRMAGCPNLKFIGVIATGYDNVNIKAAKDLGIAVTNVPGYSTDAVAQHTFALLLEILNGVGIHDSAVRAGDWHRASQFCFSLQPVSLLSGKSLGIIGYGAIGKKVASIGEAFGMKINIYSKNKEAATASDIVSLHCPVTPENKGFINSDFISKMKDGAILINTARGGLINEEDLAAALKSGKLRGAGLDVLSKEPPVKENPLIGLKNCIITPHMAWVPKESREKIITTSRDNLRSFLEGTSLNRLV